MKIAHYAPFAPNACGLYEAAKDMYTADKLAGHDPCFVDTGITIGGEQRSTPGLSGKEDNRGGAKLISVTPEEALAADIIIAHTGIPDNWIVGSQSPIIWILHGRPAACFRPELQDKGNSYTLISMLSKWTRVKAMLTFWPYHVKFWKTIISGKKLVSFPAPPIDEKRFNPQGKKHEFKFVGKFNIVFADTPREDIDIFEAIHGALEFAKSRKDVVFHFYGLPVPLKCWEVLLLEFKRLNILGDVWARKTEMEEVFRAADLLISPHRITTRVIGESLCCNTPVIAAKGCEYANWTCDIDDPESVALIIEKAVNDIMSGSSLELLKDDFSLEKYNALMDQLYANL